MISGWETVLVTAGLVAAAVNGGAFFTFSNFVMPALTQLSTETGASAMQSINRAAPNPLFVTAIVGAGVVAIPVVTSDLDRMGEANGLYLLVGVLLSLASLAITMVFNVPRNNTLAGLDATDPGAEAPWAEYVTSWTRWNTLRSVTSLTSAAAYTLSLGG